MPWTHFFSDLKQKSFIRSVGRVKKVNSLVIEAAGIFGSVGDICKIDNSRNGTDGCLAEIVGLRGDAILMMPYGETKGISLHSEVSTTGSSVSVKIGDGLLGRVIDPFGKALDAEGGITNVKEHVALRGISHNPLKRKKISEFFQTGIKAIDGFLTIGRGQRIGIFSGSGVGKSTLLGMIARRSESDVNVIALIGERGREVGDFLEKILGDSGIKRSVVVVATSDQPALIRELAAHTATAIAEYFCNQGKEVLLIVDSVTRFAMAHREIGLSVGEPSTARGYTPSAFAALPKLIERAGNFEGRGSITGIYTVLVEGDDFHEPVSDHMRSILDGHIILSREMANHGHFPAIDILGSISRLASDLWTKSEREVVKKLLKLVSIRERHKDMIDIGAYKSGSNPQLDEAILLYPAIEQFLTQDMDDAIASRSDIFDTLNSIVNPITN